MYALPQEPSVLLQVGFIVLAMSLVIGLAIVVRSYRIGLLAGAWLILTGLAGATEVLADFTSMPPRPVFLLVPLSLLIVFIPRSPLGRSLVALPLRLLVGFQAFRILVEMLIHQAVVEGVAPPQLSWSGLNLDIISGVTALILMSFVNRVPRWVLIAWNGMAAFLLAWVVGVALLSMPSPAQQLTPDNVWIAYFPFIWLPAIYVLFAAVGHVVLFQKVRAMGKAARPVHSGEPI